MVPTPVEHLVRDLSRVAPAPAVRAAAREHGALRRQGAVDIYALLMTVLLGVSVRGRVSLAELRRVYGEVTGTVLARSSFYTRFNEGFAALMKWLLDVLIADSRASPPRPPGPLSFFEDVLCEDASIFKLPDAMADSWPGPRTNSSPAAGKIHVRLRATTGEVVKVKLTDGRSADCKAFGVGHELRNTLLLVDQGYSSQSLWRRVQGVGGYFITRLPADRNPVIVRQLRRHRGRARNVDGKPLRAALRGLKRTVLDVECAFRCSCPARCPAPGGRPGRGPPGSPPAQVPHAGASGLDPSRRPRRAAVVESLRPRRRTPMGVRAARAPRWADAVARGRGGDRGRHRSPRPRRPRAAAVVAGMPGRARGRRGGLHRRVPRLRTTWPRAPCVAARARPARRWPPSRGSRGPPPPPRCSSSSR